MKFLTAVNSQWNARGFGARQVSAPQDPIDDAPKPRPRSKSIPAILSQAFRPDAEPEAPLLKDPAVIRSGHVSQPSNYVASEPPIALSFPPPTIPTNLALHSAGTITKHRPGQDSSSDTSDPSHNATPLAALLAPQVMGMDPLSHEFADFIQHIPSLYIGAPTRPLILRETEDERFNEKFVVAASHIAALARPAAPQAKVSPPRPPPRLPPKQLQKARPPSTFAFPPRSPPVPVRRDSASTLPVSPHSSPQKPQQQLYAEPLSLARSATIHHGVANLLRSGPTPGSRPLTMVSSSADAPVLLSAPPAMIQHRASYVGVPAPRAFPCAQPQRVQPSGGPSPQMRPTVIRNVPPNNKNHAHIAPVRTRVDSAPTPIPYIGSPTSGPQRTMGPRLPVPPQLAQDAYTGNNTVRGPVAAHAHLFVPRPLLLPHQHQLQYPPQLSSAPSSPNSPLFVSSASAYVEPQPRDGRPS
ncbi:hypothetical protein OC846_005709 [Tilletia horrida]|uniref:Uncharacterized protein n=1 Tax=Tilletia horrida TaxID=155126 RepID=A0AAN6JRF9_9BASI|nr:hypothetical protein OC845_005845 [Tilletia horrida]KAK0545363.1 hypothetical protein OC846_005709 [Tilletia horrida]KAK0561306.1 hypothetical protein OC861_005885 [Tilletia horrida]